MRPAASLLSGMCSNVSLGPQPELLSWKLGMLPMHPHLNKPSWPLSLLGLGCCRAGPIGTSGPGVRLPLRGSWNGHVFAASLWTNRVISLCCSFLPVLMWG